MKTLIVAACVFLTFAGLPALAAPAKSQGVHDRFSGTWEGKWDGVWKVRMTITRDDPKRPDYSVFYEWQERDGGPLDSNYKRATADGNILHIGRRIDMTLSAKDPNSANALGRFDSTRRSKMTRVSPTGRKGGKVPSR